MAFPNATIGKQIQEGDILYTNLNSDEFVAYKKRKSFLKDDEIQLLKEIAQIKRKTNPVWGV